MENFNIKDQLVDKGITNPLLLKAFQHIPKEFFLAEELPVNFYKEVNLREPYEHIEPRLIVVARMLEQLGIKKSEKILISGIDSIYILVVLSKIYQEVYSIETNESYAEWAKEVLKSVAVHNVSIKIGNQENGWQEKGLFDSIIIASEQAEVSDTIKKQLKIGGRLLAPIGPDWAHVVYEITQREAENSFKMHTIRDNYYIPSPRIIPKISSENFPENEIVDEIGMNSKPFKSIKKFPMQQLLDRVGDAKVVLLGEASHGTSEFYETRQEIAKALIEQKGFNFVCAEADWSDAEQINNYVKNRKLHDDWMPFSRFPQWMWKNEETLEFVEWLKNYNEKNNNQTGFFGLDLYGLENSIDLVINYLEKTDKELAKLARSRYACITPYMSDPSVYGKMVLNNQLQSCENEVLKILFDLLKNKNKLNHSPEFFFAYQNATVVVDAERYYKAMFYGSSESWNLRDFHMFSTLKSLLSYFGPESKAIVWAHNSHIGNAYATEMYARGEINIGHLCKEYYNDFSYHIGFGTHTGTVAAAKNWGEKMEVMNVNESLKESYEYLCHKTNLGSFTLPLRKKDSDERLSDLLKSPRLERAIGVIYRPDTERSSHYFRTVLNAQFDEYIFFDTTKAIKPIAYKTKKPKLMLNHPFGLLDE